MPTRQFFATALLIALSATFLPAQTPAPGSSQQWDQNFRDPKIKRTEPDRILVSAIANRKPGSAIDLGSGQGRNAIFLAKQGWRTTGVDFSKVAVEEAQRESLNAGVPLELVVADLESYDLGQGKWDLINLSFMQGWLKTSRRDNSKRLYDALRPGGVLVIEGFADQDPRVGIGFKTNELLRTFDKLKIIRYEDTFDVPLWGRGASERRHILRMIAEKE